MKTSARVLLCLLLAGVALPADPRAAAKRPMTETDLYKFTWVADPQISPDGASVAFVQVTVNEKDNKYESSLYTVATSGGAAPLSNDKGDKAEAKQITSGDFDERGAQWAPDGRTIYFASDRVAESYYNAGDADLYSVPATGGAITKVASIDGPIGSISVSPDGKKIAFAGALSGQPIRSYSQPDLWVVDATPGSTPKNLTESYDFDVSSGIGGEQSAPRGEQPKPIVWSKDGQSVIVVTAEKGSSNLVRVAIATGRIEPVTTRQHDVGAYTASRDAGTIAATIS